VAKVMSSAKAASLENEIMVRWQGEAAASETEVVSRELSGATMQI
jgi:hypothetical protein